MWCGVRDCEDGRPGEAVFIPPLWFHHVMMPDFSVAVNVFWRGHAAALYNPKDIYGNKDLPAADVAMAAATKAGQQLNGLPEPFRTFYARRAAAQLLAAASATGGEEMAVAFARVPAAASGSKVLLHGKVCIISGGSRGIGRHIALALACRGATVVMVCRDTCKGRKEAAAIRALSRNHEVWVEHADVGYARGGGRAGVGVYVCMCVRVRVLQGPPRPAFCFLLGKEYGVYCRGGVAAEGL